ncbi:CoA-transferase family III domain-containing protein [Zopfochytrium polystomum]|nr:CoA-transferase family III domain-containing protein [Zopfochytrium polystomum]
MILGDYGADVIKVESFSGDDTRSWGPPFAPTTKPGATPESTYFLGINRNKKSITVDFKHPSGVHLLKDLARASDVLLENYLPGKLDSLGLGYSAMHTANPGLVYASITGYGPDGPSSRRAGYDVIIEGEAGLMHITGEPRGAPVKVGVAITDVATGLFAHGAVVAALLARERLKATTGRWEGEKVDVSLIETQVAALANVAHAYLIGGVEAKRWGTRHASIVPYQSFPVKDGHIIIGAGNDRQYEKLCDILKRPDLKSNPEYKTNADRVANREKLVQEIETTLLTQDRDHWLEQLSAAGIPSGPVNNISQTFEHPQVKHRNMIREVDHPTAGKIRTVGIPVKFSESKPTIRLPPPLLGQHTDEVLSSLLGYSDAQIAELRREKAIL